MKIGKNAAVSIDYILTDGEGELIDRSEAGSPLVYLHGTGQILPALEQLLEGKSIGDKISPTLSPSEGYGIPSEDLVRHVPKSEFSEVSDLAVGMHFQVDSKNGPVVFEVMEITGDKVVLDGNHPLAGKELHFEIEVKAIREASKDEIAHGHVHGPGGHHHH